ncbi:hypothetical protein C518_3200 [Lysinibacillus fusiformis ZB2]|nr:hypothetical protein C518_3200 [Lysinibacillus fusiformis ZB2]
MAVGITFGILISLCPYITEFDTVSKKIYYTYKTIDLNKKGVSKYEKIA